MIWRSDFTQESVLHGTKIFVRYRLSDKIENSRNYKITIFRTDSNLIGKVYYQYNSTVRFTKGIKYIIPGIQSVRCLSGFFVFFIICTFMLQAACLSRVHLHAISRNVNIASRNDVVFKFLTQITLRVIRILFSVRSLCLPFVITDNFWWLKRKWEPKLEWIGYMHGKPCLYPWNLFD